MKGLDFMNADFDIKQIFQERLAISFGLDKYRVIMDRFNKTNISADVNFQRMFNGFYVVRRNEQWRTIYYDYFENIKDKNIEFADIITYIYDNTGNIEPSFASKMLATINPNKPIWDRFVLQNLNIELTGKTQEERLQNAIKLYADIELWYNDFLKTNKAKECIQCFDEILPDCKWIYDIKKIDCILWSAR